MKAWGIKNLKIMILSVSFMATNQQPTIPTQIANHPQAILTKTLLF